MTVGPDGSPVPTTVSGPYWASQLSQKLGYGVTAGEPYYFPGCTSAAQCVLPNAIDPAKRVVRAGSESAAIHSVAQ